MTAAMGASIKALAVGFGLSFRAHHLARVRHGWVLSAALCLVFLIVSVVETPFPAGIFAIVAASHAIRHRRAFREQRQA
jgi:hypothetical protein